MTGRVNRRFNTLIVVHALAALNKIQNIRITDVKENITSLKTHEHQTARHKNKPPGSLR
jgi:hypothetical protein